MSNTNNPPSSERLIEELDRGRELAAELCRLIQKSNEADHSTFVESVIGSYEKTLSMLKMYASHSTNDTISEDPSQKRKRSLPITKDLSDEQSLAKRVDNEMQNLGHEKLFRGKQKICDITCSSPTESSEKTTIVHHLDDWEIVSATPVYDGYQWRKYGQKEILNAKYPRSYYRCIHKYDQGCRAAKQVQRIQDEPTLYKTTYYGLHTHREARSLPERADDEMQNRGHDNIYKQSRGKEKISESKCSWPLLTESSDGGTDRTFSYSHEYSGPS